MLTKFSRDFQNSQHLDITSFSEKHLNQLLVFEIPYTSFVWGVLGALVNLWNAMGYYDQPRVLWKLVLLQLKY